MKITRLTTSKIGQRRRRHRWGLTLGTVLLAMSGCLPRGPISLSWPWRHRGSDCPDCDAAEGEALSAPHSMFHPVPTRPVFTPWMIDDPVRTGQVTVAARVPNEKSLDKREMPPSDSEIADRRSAVRSTAAHSASPTTAQRPSTSPTAADEYYNPSSESANGNPPASGGTSSSQWHAGTSGATGL